MEDIHAESVNYQHCTRSSMILIEDRMTEGGLIDEHSIDRRSEISDGRTIWQPADLDFVTEPAATWVHPSSRRLERECTLTHGHHDSKICIQRWAAFRLLPLDRLTQL
jgi:hypothetical protein